MYTSPRPQEAWWESLRPPPPPAMGLTGADKNIELMRKWGEAHTALKSSEG